MLAGSTSASSESTKKTAGSDNEEADYEDDAEDDEYGFDEVAVDSFRCALICYL